MASLFTVLIAGIQYLVHPQKLGAIQETINPDALIPVTLLTTAELNGDLEGTLKLFDAYDDVFTPEFASVLVEKGPGNDDSSDQDTENDIIQDVYHIVDAELKTEGFDELPSGPYILHGPNLYQAWRLYEDSQDAFEFGVFPEMVNVTGSFQTLSSLSPSGGHKAVPVPSRLYQKPPSSKKPWSNMRVSISDTMSLRGVRTTLSSRAWSSLHEGSDNVTADVVQKLIELGAVIVGKTKTSQFDVGLDWVDVEAPWNPRGDGYQSASGQSAGAGVALASYDWLQHAIGQDVLEGSREVASANGVYSLRLSPKYMSFEGVVSSSSSYDSIGLSSRSLDGLTSLTDAVLNTSPKDISLPKKLVYIEDFDADFDQVYGDLNKKFLKAIEEFLGVKTRYVNLTKVWAESAPSEANGQSMQSYMENAFFESWCYDFYHQYTNFSAAYRDQFGGEPYAEPVVQFQWNLGSNVTKHERQDYATRIEVYREWFDKNIMALNASNMSETVVVVPFGSAEAAYRTDLSEPFSTKGITPNTLTPILGLPQLVAPFAQLPYKSEISLVEEYLPVTGSILGPRGSDPVLLQVAKQAFRKAQWPGKVNTGRLTFPPSASA